MVLNKVPRSGRDILTLGFLRYLDTIRRTDGLAGRRRIGYTHSRSEGSSAAKHPGPSKLRSMPQGFAFLCGFPAIVTEKEHRVSSAQDIWKAITRERVIWFNTARNNAHGYDQRYRWGEKGDYDCSSAVITAWQTAGVPVKSKGATYTGNMKAAFLACGFTDVTGRVNLRTGAGLIRGDVLLNTTHHTAMYCGNGLEVEASINEKGTAVGGVPGDQTGREFLIRSYRNFPWNCVLRYQEAASITVEEAARGVLAGKYGNGNDRKRAIAALGLDYNTVQRRVNELLRGQTATGKKTVDQVAREVLQGKWGNGSDRRKRLTAAGYDYAAVQKRVNELLR